MSHHLVNWPNVLPPLVKLRRMRCQDCGQQFTRWEAFKIHLQKHEAEETEFKKTDKKRPLQPQNQNEDQKKRREDKDDGKDEDEGGDAGGDGEEDAEEFFDSIFQIKPSEIVMVRPRVAMLSQEEKPVYGSSNQVYKCNICGNLYHYLESLKNHQKTHSIPEVENNQQCPDCGKIFKNAINLSTHMKRHRTSVSVEPERPVELRCDLCNEAFNSTQTWLQHTEIHQNKEFWCLSCATGFKDAESLDMHLLHHNTKRHRCDICFKCFRAPAELQYHHNTHKGFKPYKCNFCHKAFPQLGKLITHRKRHLGFHKDGASDQKHSLSGRKKVSVMKSLFVGSKGAVKPPGEFLWWASYEMEERQGSSWEDEDDEEDVCNSGSTEGSEPDANKTSSGLGSPANSNSMEEDEQLVEVEEINYGEVPREDVYIVVKEEEEEEDDDVVFAGQLSLPTRQQQQGEWRCFECGTSFFQEPELHLHYMKHASGEL